MKRKNSGCKELKNLQPSLIKDNKDEDDFWDVTDPPYRHVPDEEYEENERKRYCREAHRRQILVCCQAALDYYNKRNRTNYELVEPMSSSEFSCPPIRMHLNFTAKPKSAPNDDNGDGDGSSSTKLFFGDLVLRPNSWVANKCLILKVKSGRCDFCEGRDPIKHPTRGFCLKNDFEPYALRSRARG